MARAPRKGKPVQKDYSGYLDKEPTDLQSRLTDWLKDVVGYDPTKAKTKAEAFAEGVRLTVALRMAHQASPENQEALEERRAAKEEAMREAVTKRATRKSRKSKVEEEAEEDEPEDIEDEDVEEDDVEEEPEPVKKAPARRTRKAAAPAKPAATTRTRRARTKPKGEAAPF